MKPLSKHMEDLIRIAEDTLRRTRPLSEADALTLAEIRRIDALPAETTRHTHAPLAVIAALEGLQQTDGQAPDATPWLMLMATALPLLKHETFRQFCAEKEVGRG
ncbi:hypothetical protein HL667_33660 [Bradyrhizobium sp. 83012]|uniref:Uncharacterized protein n=1 Tax=Bradyrhizobium aeschynomenes TaxID=2734909 RepID=A0ABX2CP54_9BRAD|nr:hypothetical protein [Bradyrhizobium aeschynomenes]NPU69979.1 hypothetical protein [Bradyrhizobium aeschynomenes]